MNEDKRQKLLQIIRDMQLPPEAEETIPKLSDEEVDYLISVYTDVDDYQKQLEEYVRLTNPEEYKKLNEEYGKKLEEVDDEYNTQMEKLQEEEDVQLDAIDAKADREIDDNTAKIDEEVNRVEAISDELTSVIDSEVAGGEDTASDVSSK